MTESSKGELLAKTEQTVAALTKAANVDPLRAAVIAQAIAPVQEASVLFDVMEIERAREFDGDELEKSFSFMLNGPEQVDHAGKKRASLERLTFEIDPTQNVGVQGQYEFKMRGIPDNTLKRIAVQNSLVASITMARANHISAMGKRRPNRHGLGFDIIPKQGYSASAAGEQKEFERRVKAASEFMLNCGVRTPTEITRSGEGSTFSQFLSMSTKQAVVLGRIACERRYVDDELVGFYPADAGTVYRAARSATDSQGERDSTRANTIADRQRMEGAIVEVSDSDRQVDKTMWVQVINGKIVGRYSAKELFCHNFYPSADVEMRGYPVTPMDTVLTAIMTHLSIGLHNKQFFQSGRASRGMLVLKDNTMNDATRKKLESAFNAQMNSVNNAFRTPFLILKNEAEAEYVSLEGSGGRDMEFQYLSDMTCREILSAFQISPEELPGYAHLSRGTANQALAESNQQYILTAQRDVGIRPLLAQIQDMLHRNIFAEFDPWLAERANFELLGLDAETAEKESIRLAQDMPVHMSMNDVMERVEKPAIPKHLGGDFLLNPQYQQILDRYVPVGVILEEIFGIKGASKEPEYAYLRDSFWLQAQQMRQQQEMAQQQMQMGQDQDGGTGEENTGEAHKEQALQQGANNNMARQEDQSQDMTDQNLSQIADRASKMLKSETRLSNKDRVLLNRQIKIVDSMKAAWHAESERVKREAHEALLKEVETLRAEVAKDQS